MNIRNTKAIRSDTGLIYANFFTIISLLVIAVLLVIQTQRPAKFGDRFKTQFSGTINNALL
mgnify:CR=1 FL=1